MRQDTEIAAVFAAGQGVISANLGYVEFVSESLQIKEKYLV